MSNENQWNALEDAEESLRFIVAFCGPRHPATDEAEGYFMRKAMAEIHNRPVQKEYIAEQRRRRLESEMTDFQRRAKDIQERLQMCSVSISE